MYQKLKHHVQLSSPCRCQNEVSATLWDNSVEIRINPVPQAQLYSLDSLLFSLLLLTRLLSFCEINVFKISGCRLPNSIHIYDPYCEIWHKQIMHTETKSMLEKMGMLQWPFSHSTLGSKMAFYLKWDRLNQGDLDIDNARDCIGAEKMIQMKGERDKVPPELHSRHRI